MREVKKFRIRYKRIIVALVIILIAFKSYQHFRPRNLISIIGEEGITNPSEVNIRRIIGLSSTSYDFDIDDKDDIKRLMQLIKTIKVRRYSIGNAGVSYDGHIDDITITFNDNKSLVRIEIIGKQYIMLDFYPDGVKYDNYKIIGNIDTSSIDKIIGKKITEKSSNKADNALNLYDIYEFEDDAYWDYILSGKTHMYKRLGYKDMKEENVNIVMQYVSDPIDDRGKYVDRIKKEKIEITPKEIIIDNIMVLKAPLRKGNTWKTNIELTLGGVTNTYEAIVNIEEITEETVTCRLIVPDLKEFKDNKYIRVQTYQRNFGLIYESYNDKDGFRHETKLERVFKNVIPEFIDPREFMKFNDLEVLKDAF